jgi:hypothetical protein
MRTWVDRRAVVFLCFALVCLILVWPCPEQFRWVGVVMTIGYVVLALLSWADHLGRWKSYDKR